jgi:hypothetical protein
MLGDPLQRFQDLRGRIGVLPEQRDSVTPHIFNRVHGCGMSERIDKRRVERMPKTGRNNRRRPNAGIVVRSDGCGKHAIGFRLSGQPQPARGCGSHRGSRIAQSFPDYRQRRDTHAVPQRSKKI